MAESTTPSYINLFHSGELFNRIDWFTEKYRSCIICPHNCKVDRLNSTKYGYCKTGASPVVSSYGAHFGEETPLVGQSGSGTIFFTGCNMRCVYCQNYDISQLNSGKEISVNDLAAIMLKLQKDGCHNINFVSPSHQILAILKALKIAIPNGLYIPLVYNSGGYDSKKAIQMLEGVFDIYMPDFKYFDNQKAYEYSKIDNYVYHAKSSVLEMYKQVGDLKTENKIAYRGLLIRHLVLPENISDSDKFLDFADKTFYNGIHINIMNQYRPAYHANRYKELNKYPLQNNINDLKNKRLYKNITIVE